MNGITFGSKHSYNDWGVILENTKVTPPLPKRYVVDVPARNGALDLTPELTPTIRFQQRMVTYTFRVKAGDWDDLLSEIYGDIHGRTMDVTSDWDLNWHWHGCVTVNDFASDKRTGVLVINVECSPFKLANTASVYTVSGNGAVTCSVDRMEVVPTFEIDSETKVTYGDISATLGSTRTKEKTVSGDIVSFIDGTDNPVTDLTADITAVQDLHGQSSPYPAGGGKNLLPYAESNVVNYVTYTVNSDGSIKVSGTASGVANLDVGRNLLTLPAGQYNSHIGSPTNVTQTLFKIVNGTASVLKSGGGEFTLTEETSVFMRLSVASGATASGTIYPMIERGFVPTAYAPYTNICPITGFTGANVYVRGVNLWDEEWENGGYDSTTGTKISASSRIRSKNYIPVMPSTAYYFQKPASMVVYKYDGDKNYIGYESVGNTNMLTLPSNCHYINFQCGSSGAPQTTYNHDISINYPSTDHDYHAYNGEDYATSFGSTVYGGTLNVTTGVLTVTHAEVDLGDLTWTRYSTSPNYKFYAPLPLAKDYTNAETANAICSNYPVIKYDSLASNDKHFSVGQNNNRRIAIFDSTYGTSTADDFKTAMSGVQLVYELATPTEVQLTAQEIDTLKNLNHIWADTGAVSVTYIAQDYDGQSFMIPNLELTEGEDTLAIESVGTTIITYTNGRL